MSGLSVNVRALISQWRSSAANGSFYSDTTPEEMAREFADELEAALHAHAINEQAAGDVVREQGYDRKLIAEMLERYKYLQSHFTDTAHTKRQIREQIAALRNDEQAAQVEAVACRFCGDSKEEYSYNGDGPYTCRHCDTPTQQPSTGEANSGPTHSITPTTD